MNEAQTDVVLSLEALYTLAHDVLTHHGVSDDHADAIARVIVQGQRDECHSHGVYRLMGAGHQVTTSRRGPSQGLAA